MLLKILAKARLNKKTVKVVGHGHSPSDLACTQGYMISLKHFNKILEVRITKCSCCLHQCDSQESVAYLQKVFVSLLRAFSPFTVLLHFRMFFQEVYTAYGSIIEKRKIHVKLS